jgi:hypothetical protein
MTGIPWADALADSTQGNYARSWRLWCVYWWPQEPFFIGLDLVARRGMVEEYLHHLVYVCGSTAGVLTSTWAGIVCHFSLNSRCEASLFDD